MPVKSMEITDPRSAVEASIVPGVGALSKKINRSVLVAVVGGGAVGKTSVICPAIAKHFPHSVIVSEDDYCIGRDASAALHGTPSLHVPEDYDPERMRHDLLRLKNGESVEMPQYSMDRRERLCGTKTVHPSSVVIVEGAYLLQPHLRSLFDLGVFVDTDDHSRFARRIIRPRRSATQTDAQRIREYAQLAYPAYYREVAPYRECADIIVENPYSPSEALSRLALGSPVRPNRATGSTVARHAHMEDEERLTLTSVGVTQYLTYMPDVGQPCIHLDFTVPVEEHRIELDKIGYDVKEIRSS